MNVKATVLNVEGYPALLKFLHDIIESQYDIETWVHKSRHWKVELKQKPQDADESFEPYEGMIAAFVEKDVSGKNDKYRQQDRIPEIHDAEPDGEDEETDDEGGNMKVVTKGEQPEFNILEHQKILVPRKKKGTIYKYRKSADEWVRSDGVTWRLTLFLRKFRSTTNEYVNKRVDLRYLTNADPNNEVWVLTFYKWVNQWARRATKSSLRKHVNWTQAEWAVIHDFIKATDRKDGFDSIKPTLENSTLRDLTSKVNKVRGQERFVEGIDSVFRKKKGAIHDLMERATALRARLTADEQVSDQERYPREASAGREGTQAEDAESKEALGPEDAEEDKDDTEENQEEEVEHDPADELAELDARLLEEGVR